MSVVEEVIDPLDATVDECQAHADDTGKRGQLRPTAAMMAGVTDRLWSFEDLFDEAMAT